MTELKTKEHLKPAVFHIVVMMLFLLLGVNQTLSAQNTEEDVNVDQAKSLVDFYRYMLNTVGASSTVTRDKEVIITESFKKVFRDPNVQIEDDLLPDRNAITNKNVSAYLRDVDFFFRDISFDFTDTEVTKAQRENGKDYYLVSFNSRIKATTLEGLPYANTTKRFVEINLQEEENDLKIVSIYSTKISRERELRNWWNDLSYEWSKVFGAYVKGDSATNQELLQISSIDSLDLSGNNYLLNIKPLSALSNLKYLNISNTRIENLEPIRFALQLETLIAADSRVANISLLQYFEKLKKLDLRNTPVVDLSALGRLQQLEYVDLSSVSATVFDAFQLTKRLSYVDVSNTSFSYPALLSSHKELKYLDLSRTGVGNIDYLSELSQLEYLDLSETYINTLKPLQGMGMLETLKINQTQVFDLQPLSGLKSMSRIYCDNSGITEKQAMDFMSANKSVLIIINTQKVMEWWEGLTISWKQALSPYLTTENPGKEDLMRLVTLDSLNINNKRLVDTEPLTKFKKLRHLSIDKNLFTSLEFANNLEYLEVLSAEGLPIETPSGLETCKRLEVLSVKGTLLNNISGIYNLNKLKTVDLDDTPILESQVVKYLTYNPEVVVVYQTSALISWWEGLSDEWKDVFGLSQEPSGIELHQLIEQRSIRIEEARISSLSPLDVFIQLFVVEITNSAVTSLIELSVHKELREVVCKNGPLFDLKGIVQLTNLKKLDISNTAIDDLRPLRPLLSLEDLNASGTNLKKLKGLEDLLNLKNLNISNTRVWQLDRLHDIRSLKTLVCYNTRIRSRTIEELKEVFPDCNVNYY